MGYTIQNQEIAQGLFLLRTISLFFNERKGEMIMINILSSILITSLVAVGLLLTSLTLLLGALGLIDAFCKTHLIEGVKRLVFVYDEE